ncbi:acetolactate decarboxylase [Enterococcus sp. AZ163]|uniref:acetolactate decarboxylase n=1 Tax=Enterococcus sp. AZ163 TaxID=2774638 RepID=UPI003D285BBC
MSYLYQHGTLGALMSDLMDGTEKIGELGKYGDFGLGTLSGSNGEVIILDHTMYHVNESGNVTILTGNEWTPYAAVTEFKSLQKVVIDRPMKAEEMINRLLAKMSNNLFAAVKISGVFSSMHVRVSPKQEKPYPKFVEAARNQPEFSEEKVEGTIVGLFTPELFQGAAQAGFHLHFISKDRTFGGHVMDYILKEGTAEWMEIEEFRQHFPIHNKEFLEHKINSDEIAKDIAEAE